ncbi:hypothetical protein [Chitinophaga flava]|uniref:Uncharacterized protein n=1 Tax=Chitinophaga flava TaxID=2259036 RepID=A0A365XVQ2_9BACT|nr:hypothetical protein [Chitinophaga flava]RBL90393.1 hypothetical protein DF182_28435 [Chitinophaga flava]
MKTLTYILISLLLLSATPASVEKKANAQGNVTIHVWYFHQGVVVGICDVPVFWPTVAIWGVETVNINCPSSFIVANVTEGQTLTASVWLNFTNYVTSDPLVVTADMIGAGAIDLIIEQ